MERRAASTIRLHQKEAHLKRVVSRGGSHAETRKSQVELRLKLKEDEHSKHIEEFKK